MHSATALFICYMAVLTTVVRSRGSSKSIEAAIDIQCPPCDKIGCDPRNPRKLKCRGGITRGVCNCCPQCAKVENEKCGGYRQYLGQCDEGLYCHVEESHINVIPGDDLTWEHIEPEGVCRPVPTKAPVEAVAPGDPQMQGDDADAYNRRSRPQCRPRCTADFCEKNPRAICSARANADGRSECQGTCQHTSCRACRYVYSNDLCPKCRQDDFKCIKQFGTCTRQQQCHKDRFPCKQNKKPTDLAGNGVFVCAVPDCS